MKICEMLSYIQGVCESSTTSNLAQVTKLREISLPDDVKVFKFRMQGVWFNEKNEGTTTMFDFIFSPDSCLASILRSVNGFLNNMESYSLEQQYAGLAHKDF